MDKMDGSADIAEGSVGSRLPFPTERDGKGVPVEIGGGAGETHDFHQAGEGVSAITA